jgi:hypothetical protein
MNWSNLVEKSQAKTYVLPEGWDSREKVAEDLGCSADAVRRVLAPAIKAKEVITSVFPVYDKVTKRVVRVTAFKEVKPPVKKGVS